MDDYCPSCERVRPVVGWLRPMVKMQIVNETGVMWEGLVCAACSDRHRRLREVGDDWFDHGLMVSGR